MYLVGSCLNRKSDLLWSPVSGKILAFSIGDYFRNRKKISAQAVVGGPQNIVREIAENRLVFNYCSPLQNVLPNFLEARRLISVDAATFVLKHVHSQNAEGCDTTRGFALGAPHVYISWEGVCAGWFHRTYYLYCSSCENNVWGFFGQGCFQLRSALSRFTCLLLPMGCL